MLSSNNIKNILTNLFNKNKQETDKQYNHLKTNMNKGWISSGTIEELHGVSDASAPFDYYSEDEQLIGQWIDGKPLYRLSYVLPKAISIPSNGWIDLYNTLQFDIPDKEIIISAKISLHNTKDIAIVPLVFAANYNNTHHIGLLQTRNGSQPYDAGNILTFEYTKTTDTSIDKKEIVANGINMQLYDGTHYSTEEKVIGQWIDGKPLYRKVLNISLTAAVATWYKLSDKIDNINLVNSILISENGARIIGHEIQNNDNPGFAIELPNGFGTRKLTQLVIEYTKTTDEPFSVTEDIAWVALDSDVNDVLNNIGE